MKLFETILTYKESTEVYKRYDYFKSLGVFVPDRITESGRSAKS